MVKYLKFSFRPEITIFTFYNLKRLRHLVFIMETNKKMTFMEV